MEGMSKLKLHSILKVMMVDKGVSAREVARACDIPQSTIVSYLSGRGTQSPEHILKLAEYFGTTMEHLLFGKDAKVPTLNDVLTEHVFDGWLRVKIERAVPNRRKGE